MSTSVCVCVCVSVCLSVCLSESISREPRARSLRIFVHVVYGCGSVLLRQGDEIPRKGAILGIFFPTDNALYSIAFSTHTKTAEAIEMPFGMITRVGPKYRVLDGDAIHQGERVMFGGKRGGHCKVMGQSTVSCTTRLNRSRCRFGRRLRWTQGTMY